MFGDSTPGSRIQMERRFLSSRLKQRLLQVVFTRAVLPKRLGAGFQIGTFFARKKTFEI